MVNHDHVPLSIPRNSTNFNPVYLRNAMVDLLTRPPRKETEMSTDVAIPTEDSLVAVRPNKFVPVKADIDHLASHHKALMKARADLKQLKAYVEVLEDKFKEELTKLGATDGRIKGAVVVTYRPKEAFRWAEFRDAHPQIHDKFLRQVTVEKLDEVALLREHGGLLEDFRSSAFNVK